MKYYNFINSKTSNITTYSYGEFLVDVTDKLEEYEAFIYHKDYGVKDLMFGVSKDQNTLDEFMEIVFYNLPKHIDTYKSEYMN